MSLTEKTAVSRPLKRTTSASQVALSHANDGNRQPVQRKRLARGKARGHVALPAVIMRGHASARVGDDIQGPQERSVTKVGNSQQRRENLRRQRVGRLERVVCLGVKVEHLLRVQLCPARRNRSSACTGRCISSRGFAPLHAFQGLRGPCIGLLASALAILGSLAQDSASLVRRDRRHRPYWMAPVLHPTSTLCELKRLCLFALATREEVGSGWGRGGWGGGGGGGGGGRF